MIFNKKETWTMKEWFIHLAIVLAVLITIATIMFLLSGCSIKEIDVLEVRQELLEDRVEIEQAYNEHRRVAINMMSEANLWLGSRIAEKAILLWFQENELDMPKDILSQLNVIIKREYPEEFGTPINIRRPDGGTYK